MQTFLYNKISDVTVSYGTHLDFIAVFGYFNTLLTALHVLSAVSLPNFHRLCVLSIHIFWYVDMSDVTTC